MDKKSLYRVYNISVEDFDNFWSKFNVIFGQVDKRKCDSGVFQATANKLGQCDAPLRQKPVHLPGNVYMLAFTLMLLGSQTNHFLTTKRNWWGQIYTLFLAS